MLLRSHLGPTSGTTHLMDLVNFFLILSNHFRLRTVRRFSMRTHLSHTLHHFTNTCLPHGEPCSIKPNFILGSSFPCCAWLCCHTHAHPTCSCFSAILPPPCSCIMPLTSIMPALDSIGRSGTNMYIHYDSIHIKAKESTDIPSLILLEFHPSKIARLITWPATPPWAKPRLVVETRPPPRASSVKAI